MPRIIIPFGRPVVHVAIEIDANGQLQVKNAKTVGGVKQPMALVEVLLVLAQATAGLLTGTAAGLNTEEAGNGKEERSPDASNAPGSKD